MVREALKKNSGIFPKWGGAVFQTLCEICVAIVFGHEIYILIPKGAGFFHSAGQSKER